MRPSSQKSMPPSAVPARAPRVPRRSRYAAAAAGIALALCLAPSADAAQASSAVARPAEFALPTPWSVFTWLTGGPGGSLWPAAPNPPAAPRPRPVPHVSTHVQTASAPGPEHAIPQVLAQINRARAQAGLPAYTITRGLTRSAVAHNQAMVGGCGLSHQCAGEDELGARETAAAVRWTSVGENVAEGGPVADTDPAIAQMAAGLNQDMLDEAPPDDGHRRNMLSRSFRHIGIAIHRDRSGTVWMTQDFSD